jgi:preprotein translocase subunit SecE
MELKPSSISIFPLIPEFPNFQILKFFSVNKVANYFKESYKELMEKVTWPTWSELQQSTVIVLVATILITVLVAVMDVFSNGILKFIYSLLS